MTTNFTEDVQIDGTSVILGIAAGYKIARGTSAATASVDVATGLTTITGYAVAGVGTTATAANNGAFVTSKPQAGTPGTLSVYRWKHTGATTPTFVAATTAGTISWIAVGT